MPNTAPATSSRCFCVRFVSSTDGELLPDSIEDRKASGRASARVVGQQRFAVAICDVDFAHGYWESDHATAKRAARPSQNRWFCELCALEEGLCPTRAPPRGGRPTHDRRMPEEETVPKKKLCQKKSYSKRADAHVAIAAMAQRYGPLVYKKPYWCGKCKAWHITSTPPRSGPRRVKN